MSPADFLQREYAKHPGSVSVVYAGEIGLGCLNGSATATGIQIGLSRDFVLRYNAATRGIASLDPPDPKMLWNYLRQDIEKNRIPLQEDVSEFSIPAVLKELSETREGIRFEYDLFPGMSKIHREETILSVMQNLECIDFAEDHS